MRPEAKWKGMYSAGGICFLLAGVLYIIGLTLFVTIPQMATGAGEEALTIVAGASLVLRTATGVFILLTILTVPGILALYLALRNQKRTHMVIATSFLAMASALFLGTSVLYYGLIGLGGSFMAATGEQRAAYVAAYQLGSGAFWAGQYLAQALLSVGVLILASVMMKGVFGKPAAYFSALAGVAGLIGSIPAPELGLVFLISNVLLAIWLLLIGYELYKVG